ncbi:MAG: DNA primase [Candidatus Parcubacteria bacterium]|nr:MAG: DNA primase [Candidatus Parcubacteria bacterium]
MNIEEIKNRLDIVEVVSRYVKLKRAGKYYSGLCPFHKETKPSFYVSPEMQIFKCFGCSVGGDVIKFLMQIENLNYAQVLEKIKEEYGIDTGSLKGEKFKSLKEEKEVLEINYSALKFFRQELKKNEEVLDYLLKRGLKKEIINFFEIGFSPGHTLLRDYLYSQGYSYELIKKAGLIDNQNFDRFQSRIIFPLRDEKGKLVGFTGRIFPDNFPGPKYLNTPETLIFKKSQFLYGLYFAKEYILVDKKIILVEGQFDFLLAWQNNLKNIVAVSGSALTEDHLRKLKKYASNLILAFDNDEAGFKASLRANLMAQQLGFKTFRLIYPGKDLGEYFGKIQTNTDYTRTNADISEEKFEDYLLNYLLNNYQDKGKILAIFLPQIKNLSAIEIDNYLNQLSVKLNIDKSFLEKELKNLPDSLRREINLPREKISNLSEEKTLEEKFSLRAISLIYTLLNKQNYTELTQNLQKSTTAELTELTQNSQKSPDSSESVQCSSASKNNSDSSASVLFVQHDIKDFTLYLSEKFKQLFLKVLENKLDEEEFNYLEMTKNFYLTTNLNLKKELERTVKNLKILFLKKNIKQLNEKLKFANEDESVKILNEIKNIAQELRKISKNA